MLTLGIDSGTQSTKAVVLDVESGKVLAEARAPHALIEGLPPGHMEQHPAHWVAAMETVIQAVLSKVDRAAVRAIGISGQQHGFVPLDASGSVIRPAKLWCDTSTQAECDLLTEALGGERAVIDLLGNRFLPGFTAPKILWLKRHEPENFRRLHHILLPHDYLNFHLTGVPFMEFGDASGTALLRVRERVWCSKACAAIDPGVEGMLPKLSGSDSPAGTLRPEIAGKFGLSSSVVVSAGGGDNMMGAIGTGNVRPGVVTASFGTSGTIYACSASPVIDPKGEIAAFCDSAGGWLPLLCTMNVTTVTELMRNLFGRDHACMAAAIESVPAGSDGLLLLPYLDGERTPSVPKGTGALLGVTRRTLTAGHFLRAAMEGVTLGMNYGLRRLGELGVRPSEIRITGGGAKSPVWRRIMADIFGVPVVAMRDDEGAALGGAIQGAWCLARQTDSKASLGEITDRCVALNEDTRVEPGPDAAIYRELQSRQDMLGAALAPLMR
jgi:xylulokinase